MDILGVDLYKNNLDVDNNFDDFNNFVIRIRFLA